MKTLFFFFLTLSNIGAIASSPVNTDQVGTDESVVKANNFFHYGVGYERMSFRSKKIDHDSFDLESADAINIRVSYRYDLFKSFSANTALGLSYTSSDNAQPQNKRNETKYHAFLQLSQDIGYNFEYGNLVVRPFTAFSLGLFQTEYEIHKVTYSQQLEGTAPVIGASFGIGFEFSKKYFLHMSYTDQKVRGLTLDERGTEVAYKDLSITAKRYLVSIGLRIH